MQCLHMTIMSASLLFCFCRFSAENTKEILCERHFLSLSLCAVLLSLFSCTHTCAADRLDSPFRSNSNTHSPSGRLAVSRCTSAAVRNAHESGFRAEQKPNAGRASTPALTWFSNFTSLLFRQPNLKFPDKDKAYRRLRKVVCK